MIVLFAVLINKEKINAVKMVSILLGMAGVVIIITNGRFISINFTNLAGDMLIIASTIAWALFSSLGKKSRIDISVANYVYIFISFLLSGISMFIFSDFVVPGISVIGGLFWIGLFEFVFGYYLWLRVLKVAPSALIASISFISPFVTILFIMLLIGERITWAEIEGLIIILFGVALQKLYPSGFRARWKRMTSNSKGNDCEIL
jgi:drug/metabolite transporter (DMT)-like permease